MNPVSTTSTSMICPIRLLVRTSGETDQNFYLAGADTSSFYSTLWPAFRRRELYFLVGVSARIVELGSPQRYSYSG